MPRRHRTTRVPSKDETAICFGDFELGDFFDGAELNELTALGRLRIIGVFRHAKMTVRDHVTDHHSREFDNHYGLKGTRTRIVDADNYILGVENKRSALSARIMHDMRNYFVRRLTLRKYEAVTWVLDLPDSHIDAFIANLTEQILTLELDYMLTEGEIWFDMNHGGIWQIKQSVVDEHLRRREAARDALKFDQRPEHGQVRKHRKERNRSSGSSTGMTGRSGNGSSRRSW